MATSDLVGLLEIVGAAVSHPALTPDTLKGVQVNVKAFINDKEWLQDVSLLSAIDKILKYGTAAQVSAAYIPPPFDPKDYVTPRSAEEEPALSYGSVPEIAES